MAGNITLKEVSIITLSSAIAALVQNGGGLANATANLDCRSGGNAVEVFDAAFELIVQWSTVTSIVSGTIVGDLYLVPALDGTKFPLVDIANASTDYISANQRVGSFINPLHNPATGTDYRFVIQGVQLQALLYRPYIINRSGQTFTANATLKCVPEYAQYT